MRLWRRSINLPLNCLRYKRAKNFSSKKYDLLVAIIRKLAIVDAVNSPILGSWRKEMRDDPEQVRDEHHAPFHR